MNRNEFIQMIYDDFERMFPETAKKVVDWYVSGRYSITVVFPDNSRAYYNYLDKVIRSTKKIDENGEPTEQEKRRIISERLKERMANKGLTQKALSEVTGISQMSISKYIRGISEPTISNAYLIADALECSVDELFGDY